MQANLVATSAAFAAQIVSPQMVNAWGIAIRPAGAGGHFWVNGGGSSWEFVGDVKSSATPSLQTLATDQLTQVTMQGSARFIFVTDAGSINARTEHCSFRRIAGRLDGCRWRDGRVPGLPARSEWTS